MPCDLNLVQSLMPAAFGLVGVIVGGSIASRNQRAERRQRRIREQVDGFYGPMVGIHQEIRARFERDPSYEMKSASE